MKENSIYDKKSLRTVVGKNADFNELAKDCVAFSNAEGGSIDIGIEDGPNSTARRAKDTRRPCYRNSKQDKR